MTRYKRLRRSPLLSLRLWKRRIAFWLGALLVGLVAIAFAFLADHAGDLFLHITAGRRWVPFLLAPAGLAFSVLLTRAFFPGAQGSGIPQVIAALHMTDRARIDAVLSLRIAGGKVVLTLLGLLCGASIGREGPTVQVSATLMHALGRLLRLPRQDAYRALVLGGGAAGIAGAFNTPLAGVVFAIEELSHSFESRTAGVVLTAVVIAGITTMGLQGNYTYFGTATADVTFGIRWVAVLVCGVAGGVMGGCFSSALLWFARGVPGRAGVWIKAHPIGFAALCGLALALIGLASDGASFGTGYAQASALVANAGAVPPRSFFIWKFAATVVSYVSGIPGGIFAPSLAVGSGLGHALSGMLPLAPAGTVVLLGMVAYFSGVVQAPITSTIIVMEMTNDGSATIPLMATAVVAYGASRLVCRRPLYGALARLFLLSLPPETAPDLPPPAAAKPLT